MGIKGDTRCTIRGTSIPYVPLLSPFLHTPANPLADSAVLDDSRILVSGGYDGYVHVGDLHALELASCAHLPQVVCVCWP